jgi:CubicO group peptidase (beta-lactamase class C family)
MTLLTGLILSLFVGVGAALPAVPRAPVGETDRQHGSAVDRPSRSDAGDDAAIATFMDRYVARAVEIHAIPGATLIVVRGGRVILSRGYGVADRSTARPVSTERTLFRQASISKLLIWIVALQLAQEGRLDLDRDIQDYIDFTMPRTSGLRVTMRHLMTHSAGFAERYWGVLEPGAATDSGPELRAALPVRPYAAGEAVAYSNYGAALAAHILERVAGRPYGLLVQERIFTPLGMSSSTLSQPPSNLKELTQTYIAPGDAPVAFERVGAPAAGGLSAPSEDMGRLLTALLAREASEPALLAPATLRAALTLQRPLAPPLRDGFGLGFVVGEYRGVRHAGHSGDLIASAADLRILPDQSLGWHIAFNGPGAGGGARHMRDALTRAVIDRFFAPDAAPQPRDRSIKASGVGGVYLSTRRARSGPVLIADPLRLVRVTEAASGDLLVHAPWLFGAPARFVPIAPDIYAEERTGRRLAVTRNARGQVTRLASAMLDPLSEFERAPRLLRLAMPALSLSLAILIASAGLRAIGGLRARKAATIAATSGKPSGWIATLGSCWIPAAAAIVGMFFGRVDADPSYFYSANAARQASAIAALSVSPVALVMTFDAVRALAGHHNWLDKSARVAAACAAILVAVFVACFGLADLSKNY